MRVDRDKKISIISFPTDASNKDEYGAPNTAAPVTVVSNAWASISPIFGKEYFQSEEVQSKTTTKIELDYIDGITRSMQVIYGARTFENLNRYRHKGNAPDAATYV